MSNQPDLLVARSEALIAGAGDAISWVEDARKNSTRLERDAKGLVERLRRARNLARRLGAAARLPMSVGVFGPSQAGKSYLVSALARGPDGLLETVLDGQRLDFIEHINPYGGGKEATGLVTRFTWRPVDEVPGYPVHLLLMSEADVVKVLGNSFFNDFDRERTPYETNPENIHGRLSALEVKRQGRATGGLDEDDVVDIWDYFERRFEKSMKGFGGYWPQAVALAPYLLPKDRADLFSLLWGQIPDLTEAYLQLRGWLDRLGHARMVRAPKVALVRETPTGLSKAESILNVGILNRFGKDAADTLRVVPVVDGSPGADVPVPRSLLAALTMEMSFTLASAPQAALLESVDLIDFPGYRARLQVTSLEEVKRLPDVIDPVAELILRGKVAYLFERYTEDQQMNVLLLCVPSDGQIEVPALRTALDAWVDLTQGETAAERAHTRPGLMWVVTKFDRRLEQKPGVNEDNLLEGWDNLIFQALLERFATADWLREWASGRPFDNVFLVRKPGMAAGVVDCDEGGRETGIGADQRDRLDLLRRTFLGRPAVLKHIRDAEEAWDGMLALDDGGMSRITGYLDVVARVEYKWSRIGRQIEQLTKDLVDGELGVYFRAEGAEEVERKRQIAEMIVSAIRGRVRDNPGSFAELLLALQPVPESLRSLYLNAETQPEAAGTSAPSRASRGVLFDVDEFDVGDSPTPGRGAALPSVGRRAAVFARAAVSDWVGRLRKMPDSPELHRFLGLPGETLQALVDELITGAMRLGLEERLAAALHQAEVRAGTVRARLADQQVLVATTLFDEFVDYLGCAELALDRRPGWKLQDRQRPAFAPPAPIPANALPVLGANPFNYSALFLMDWLTAFRATVIANAGHAAGQELTAEQNAQLGKILQSIAGATLGAAGAATGA